jgi:cytochrome d ubiquinol oxidase subunit II
VLAALLLGVALGNIAWGIPLDERGVFAGTFFGLLNPYALLTGVTTVALFMMHGSIYLHLKTEGDLQAQVRTWIRPCMIFFVVSYALLTMATLIYVPRASAAVREHPSLFIVVALSILAIANIPREIFFQRAGRAFLSSSATVVLVMALFGLNTFPEMVHSNPMAENSLTAYNASSSQKTLTIMFIIAAIGMPIVVAYTLSIYWVFRGKVKLTESSY